MHVNMVQLLRFSLCSTGLLSSIDQSNKCNTPRTPLMPSALAVNTTFTLSLRRSTSAIDCMPTEHI